MGLPEWDKGLHQTLCDSMAMGTLVKIGSQTVQKCSNVSPNRVLNRFFGRLPSHPANYALGDVRQMISYLFEVIYKIHKKHP